MPVYQIRLPETYNCSATSATKALEKFHARLTELLNSGYDLDAEVSEVPEEVDVDLEEPDLFVE